MIFHSWDFVFFLIFVVGAYWMMPRRPQNIFLLIASCVFYGYVHPWFLIFMFVSAGIDYLAAIYIEKYPHKKLFLLLLSLAGNLGILCYFKYTNFLIDNFKAALTGLGINTNLQSLDIILPVGVSFYTFQSLSYTIDVYRGQLKARRNLIDFMLFISFFPQLVAGPIERASKLLEQVERDRHFNKEIFVNGLLLIVWGLCLKLVVADNVAILANKAFALSAIKWPIVWAGTFAFCIQIYADFLAYSTIARGAANVLGFDLMKNFNHPYLAVSPGDFWSRWHISLSTWFRDYVYIPLGGSRGNSWKTGRNILIVFILSGIWHGASWNFVIWGFYHGLLLLVFRPFENKIHSLSRRSIGYYFIFCTLCFVLVNIGWLMFRETHFQSLVEKLFSSWTGSESIDFTMGAYLLTWTVVFSIPLFIHSLNHFLSLRGARSVHIGKSPMIYKICGIVILLWFISCFYSEQSSDFIYFQF